MTDLDELERLYAAATKGPWRLRDEMTVTTVVADIPHGHLPTVSVLNFNSKSTRKLRDATCVVAIANAFPALAAELRALRELEAALDQCESTRGRFSCSPQHDARCQKDRKIGDCTCGSDRLNAALQSVERARDAK